ncbi:MAG: ATP-binding cassette domain-containing protein [Gammaproteobacteria bacterium]
MAGQMLHVEHISNSFPGVKSLDDVSFSTQPGEVHAVVGENGAGKSTLVKIVAGAYQPDAGTIEFEGQERHWSSPHHAQAAGIHIIQGLIIIAATAFYMLRTSH